MNDYRHGHNSGQTGTHARSQNIKLMQVLVKGWPHCVAVACADIEDGDQLLTVNNQLTML